MSRSGLRYGQGYERPASPATECRLAAVPSLLPTDRAERLERAARAVCRVRRIDPDECIAFEPGRGCTLRRWQTQVTLVEAVLAA